MRSHGSLAYDTAVDFRARLRFPRAAAEPPRRLPSNQQLEVTKLSKPNFPLPIKKFDRFIVQVTLQLTYFCPSLFL